MLWRGERSKRRKVLKKDDVLQLLEELKANNKRELDSLEWEQEMRERLSQHNLKMLEIEKTLKEVRNKLR